MYLSGSKMKKSRRSPNEHGKGKPKDAPPIKHTPQENKIKETKVKTMVALNLRGVKAKDLGLQYGVHERTIKRTLHWAAEMGIVEEVASQMARELLPKAAGVYAQIIDTDAATLAEHPKGHEVR